jgi:CRP-like cAMP-binding protein
VSFTRDKNRHQLADHHVRPVLARLAPIPAREWRHAATLLRHVVLAPGEALTRAGDVASHLGFVVRGLVRKVHVTERGTPVVRDFGGPGAVVGAYVSLLTGQPSYLSVEALQSTELLVLDAAHLEALYARHVCWQIVGRRFAEIALVEREQRAHELLTASATERFRLFCQRHAAILPELRSYDIASYLGITPVSLSRLRARARRTARPSG